MSEKLIKYFKSFALYGNLWNISDDYSLYIFCMEAILEEYNMEEEEFISLFEKYCDFEYEVDWTKKERAKKWYIKYNTVYTALKYLSKKYTFWEK